MGAWVLVLAGVAIFVLLGALAGICHGVTVQVCPECLSEMRRGARRCPHCHAVQPVRKAPR